MRKAFLEGCKTFTEARKRAPWGSFFARADGGFWAFEGYEDYRIWRQQK